MEDDLNFFWKTGITTSTKMEDSLKKNGRQPQQKLIKTTSTKNEWKTTLLFKKPWITTSKKMKYDLKKKYKWKTTWRIFFEMEDDLKKWNGRRSNKPKST